MLLAFVWTREMCVDWRTDDEVFDDDTQDDDWIQFANITSQFPVYIIEVLMVVDYAIYQRYAELGVTRLLLSSRWGNVSVFVMSGWTRNNGIEVKCIRINFG